MLTHKGYSGQFTIDFEDNVIHGRVIGTRDVISFAGDTPEEAAMAFRDSVDDYLAFCAERGEQPEQPFSGKFNVRMPADLHRSLSTEAELAGMSLNALVLEKLIHPATRQNTAGKVKGEATSRRRSDKSSQVASRAKTAKTEELNEH